MQSRVTTTILLTMAALWLLMPAMASAEVPLFPNLNYLTGASKVTGEGCGIDLQLLDRAGLNDAVVENAGQEVSVLLSRTYVDPPTRTLITPAGSCVERVRAYQITKNQVKVVLTLRASYQGERSLTLRPTEGGLRLYVGEVPAGAVPPAVEAPAEPAPETAPAADEQAKINLAQLLADSPATPAPTPAPETKPPAAPAIASAVSGDFEWKSAVVKVVTALCVALGLLFLLVALAKRLRLPARMGGGKSGLIRVVQTGALDLKRRIAVIDVAGELIVVALAGNEVTMLTKIESEEARRRILHVDEPVKPASTDEPAFVAAETVQALPSRAETEFADRLKAQQRRASNDWEVVDNGTLKAIAARVKEMKRL